MNVVDSSAWIEVFADGANAHHFMDAVGNVDALLVPSIVLFEVTRRLLREGDDARVLKAITYMHRGHILPLTAGRAEIAARCSVQYKLPMADSIVYASALAHEAVVWTQDADFANLPNVRYIAKPKTAGS